METITWIIDHWQAVITAATSLVAAASAVCALTPTPKDDAIVARLYKLLDLVALNVGKAKDR